MAKRRKKVVSKKRRSVRAEVVEKPVSKKLPPIEFYVPPSQHRKLGRYKYEVIAEAFYLEMNLSLREFCEKYHLTYEVVRKHPRLNPKLRSASAFASKSRSYQSLLASVKIDTDISIARFQKQLITNMGLVDALQRWCESKIVLNTDNGRVANTTLPIGQASAVSRILKTCSEVIVTNYEYINELEADIATEEKIKPSFVVEEKKRIEK